MGHLLEQYNSLLITERSKFNKLIGSKMGNVRPLVEQDEQTTESTDPFDDPNHPIYQVGQTLTEFGFVLTQQGQGNNRSITYTRQSDGATIVLGVVPSNTQYSAKPYTISINNGKPTYFKKYEDIGILLSTLSNKIPKAMTNPNQP